ncbi:MAG: GTP cyclohydrolase, FolE2/MptA family [Candidatus Altiarchaeota archaeon]
MNKKDTQDEKPDVREDLHRVGVTHLRTIVQTEWRGHRYKFIPRIRLTVDLPKDRKGAHMSRLVEAITESIEEESGQVYGSLELLERRILERLLEKHPYTRGEVSFNTELVVERKTPKTGRKTMEAHDVFVTVIKENGVFKKKLKVRVVGNTVCPHSMENTGGKPHIQRAVAELTVESDISSDIPLESMIRVCEDSFSSPVYTLLKTEDEAKVVEDMYANPKFVEDVAREIIECARTQFKNANILARVTSMESIHRHDVMAEGRIQT